MATVIGVRTVGDVVTVVVGLCIVFGVVVAFAGV